MTAKCTAPVKQADCLSMNFNSLHQLRIRGWLSLFSMIGAKYHFAYLLFSNRHNSHVIQQRKVQYSHKYQSAVYIKFIMESSTITLCLTKPYIHSIAPLHRHRYTCIADLYHTQPYSYHTEDFLVLSFFSPVSASDSGEPSGLGVPILGLPST